MTTLYTAKAVSTGGRAGHVETDDSILSFDLSSPGSGGKGTNPEQLFACGYAACFGSAMEAVAKMQKLDAGVITIASAVNLNKDDSGYSLSVTLIANGEKLDETAGKKLMEDAHQMCPYSKATRGNIEVKLVYGKADAAKAA